MASSTISVPTTHSYTVFAACTADVRLWYLLNPEKSEALVIGTSSQLQVTTSILSPVSVAGVDPPVADKMKSLSVVLDHSHATTVARTWNYHIQAIRHIRHLLTTKLALTLAYRASYYRSWTTVTLCCTEPRPAAYRKCSASRTQHRASFSKCLNDRLLSCSWNTGFLFVKESTTNWQFSHTKPAVHPTHDTSAVTWTSLSHDIVASDTLSQCHGSVVNSKHFYLDSHIT